MQFLPFLFSHRNRRTSDSLKRDDSTSRRRAVPANHEYDNSGSAERAENARISSVSSARSQRATSRRLRVPTVVPAGRNLTDPLPWHKTGEVPVATAGHPAPAAVKQSMGDVE